ncbi:MAG: hypothetical protein K2Y21_16465 [Phycisphaerales bacterium]|nr:hypothetical protein [Phycisphaerales bacterium]
MALPVEALRDLCSEKETQINAMKNEAAVLRAENAALRERLNSIERVVAELAGRISGPSGKN